jgi:hypothetical protein
MIIDENTNPELRAIREIGERMVKAEAAIERVRGVLDELEIREQESVSSDADAYGEAWLLLKAALNGQD